MNVAGFWPRGEANPAEQGFAGDGKQPPLVPRSGYFPRLKPGVRRPSKHWQEKTGAAR